MTTCNVEEGLKNALSTSMTMGLLRFFCFSICFEWACQDF